MTVQCVCLQGFWGWGGGGRGLRPGSPRTTRTTVRAIEKKDVVIFSTSDSIDLVILMVLGNRQVF